MKLPVAMLLVMILMVTTLSYATTNTVLFNLPEKTEDGEVSFEKMTDEELLLLKELLEAEIQLRNITMSETPQSSLNLATKTPTMGERNALKSAQSYLNFMAFSYSGLINQLTFDGYTKEEATYAADNCGANWFDQAYASAESYLRFTSFSRKGLINQLCYDGYTREQAEYAAEKVGY